MEDYCEVAAGKGERFTFCDYHKLEGSFYKLDILGHSATAMLNNLRLFTGVNPVDIDLDDANVKEFFMGKTPYRLSGIPECRDRWAQRCIEQYNMSSFDDMVKFCGLSHGTNTWLGNASDLIDEGVASINDVIANRDDVFDYCIQHGINRIEAFEIATDVRSGRGISKENERIMLEHEIPNWYIDSCNKIKYLFPRAHNIAYALLMWRAAYYKIHHPEDFFRSYFGNMALKESVEIAKRGYKEMKDILDDLYLSETNDHNMRMIWDLETAEEMYYKGFDVL